jgi:hypothetical protein
MDDAALLEQLVGSALVGMLSSAPLATAAPSTVSKMNFSAPALRPKPQCYNGVYPAATQHFAGDAAASTADRPGSFFCWLEQPAATAECAFSAVPFSHLWAMDISHASVNDPADTHLLALPGSWDPAHHSKVVQYEGWQARPLPRWLPGPALSCLHAFSSAWHPEAWELARTAAGNAAGQLSEMKGPS